MKKNKKLTIDKQEAFTLIELMVSMTIIAIIAVLIIGAITLGKREAAVSQHRNNAQVVQETLEHYFSLNGKYPVSCGEHSDCPTAGKLPCICSFRQTVEDNNAGQDLGVRPLEECLTLQGGHDIADSQCPGGTCDSDGGGIVEYTAAGGYILHVANYNCSSVEQDISNNPGS